jgi:hypothetical protein
MTTALIFGLIALALIFYGLAAATYIIHARFPGLSHPVADDGPPIVLGSPRPGDDDDLGQTISLLD